MNIYCNGDSFTAGGELLDFLLPEFPGYRKEGDPFFIVNQLTKSEKEWYSNRIRLNLEKYGSMENFENAQRAAAWPKQLEKIDTSLNVNNAGSCGSSILGIANRTILDLLESKRKGIYYSYIFIQLTAANRIEIFDSEKPDDLFLIERSAGFIDTMPTESSRKIGKAIVTSYREEEYSLKYLFTLNLLIEAIKGITGITPIILGSCYSFLRGIVGPIQNKEELKNNDQIKILLSNTNILSMSDDNVMETIHNKNNFLYCPCFHYEIRTHEEFAKLIYNKYIK